MFIDVFNQDPFTSIALTEAVERNPFLPNGLGAIDGLFDFNPIRAEAVAVEQRQGKLSLIQTSDRGAPRTERTTELRQIRYFQVPRLFHGDRLTAREIANIREFGSETETMQAQKEIGRRLNGPTGLLSNIEYTWEHMRLGSIQGLFLDADGTVIYNWFNEFGIVQPTEVPFNLSASSPVAGSMRTLCTKVVRGVTRAAQGAFTPRTTIHALCDDVFWDALIAHPDVRTTYLNWVEAAELRKGTAFDAMPFGGILWFNYRGSDDLTTVAPATGTAKFFPVNAPGIFQQVASPAEDFPNVNTPGKKVYVKIIPDEKRQEYVDLEAKSYPLFLCTRPEVLWSARAGT